jgi:hypothetical protein
MCGRFTLPGAMDELLAAQPGVLDDSFANWGGLVAVYAEQDRGRAPNRQKKTNCRENSYFLDGNVFRAPLFFFN